MLWLLIILMVIAGLLLWILLVPVILYLDTSSQRYTLSLPGVFRAVIVPSDNIFHIRGWIFFIPYRFNPFRLRKKKPEKKKKKKKKKTVKKRRRIPSGSIRMVLGALRSIRIRKLSLDLDTDNFIWNARLIPVFSMVHSECIQMTVNFDGRASLLLDMRFRLGVFVWMITRYKINSFFNL